MLSCIIHTHCLSVCCFCCCSLFAVVCAGFSASRFYLSWLSAEGFVLSESVQHHAGSTVAGVFGWRVGREGAGVSLLDPIFTILAQRRA